MARCTGHLLSAILGGVCDCESASEANVRTEREERVDLEEKWVEEEEERDDEESRVEEERRWGGGVWNKCMER